MKKNLLLLVCLSFISFLAMGQRYEMTQKSNKISEFENRMLLSTSKDPMALIKLKKLKTIEFEANELVAPKTIQKNSLKSAIVAGETTIDTTHMYPWNAETQQWDTIPNAQMISYYDEQHNLVRYLTFTWNAETNSWLESSQFLYTYNSSNQVLNITEQASIFDGDSNYFWIDINNSVYEYNSLGQESKYVYQFFNYDTYDWEASWQQEFFYDLLGNNILIMESYWDASASQWNPGLKVVNQFDELNHKILNPIQFWDSNSNSWINSYQYVYEYNSSGNNITKRIQKWNPDLENWGNYLLETFAYNESNNIDNYLVQMWDQYLFKWFDSQRGIYKYDSSGNNKCILGETYDPYSDTWNTSWIKYYGYNDQNKQISNESLYWDSGMGIWASGSQTKNLKINPSEQNVTTQNVAASLVIYPNPAKEFVNIQNNVDINQIQMFDMLGNKISLKNYNGLNSIQLDIANLTSGVYFLMIKDSNGTSFTQRLVKQ